MSNELVIGILGGGGMASIVAAVVAGLFSKRKLGAEATDIITKAAAGVVTTVEAELNRQIKAREEAAAEHRVEIEEMRAAREAEMAEVRRVLQLHVAWDAIAIAKLAVLGVEMPPAPPLLPAQRGGV